MSVVARTGGRNSSGHRGGAWGQRLCSKLAGEHQIQNRAVRVRLWMFRLKSPVAEATGLEFFAWLEAAGPPQARGSLEVERVGDLPAHAFDNTPQGDIAVRIDAGRHDLVALTQTADVELDPPIDLACDLLLVTDPGVQVVLVGSDERLVHVESALGDQGDCGIVR